MSSRLTSGSKIVPDAQNSQTDLAQIEACRAAVRGAKHVYNLAADMGGMGFIPCCATRIGDERWVRPGAHMLSERST